MGKARRPEINWNWLHSFCVTAEHSSVKLAAAELGVSSSTVSEAIQNLETQLQTKLFLRGARRIELTAQGRALYNRAKAAFENQHLIFESLNLHCEQRPPIAIGLVPSDGFVQSFDFINRLTGRARQSKMSVRSCDHASLERQLERGEIDLGLTDAFVHSPHLACVRLTESQIHFYAHRDFFGQSIEQLLTQQHLGLLGAERAHFRLQDQIGASFPGLHVNYIFTDYPSLLVDLCAEKKR